MQADLRSRKNLEEFLQDLICVVSSPEEVGALVEVLMALQLPAPRETPGIRANVGRAYIEPASKRGRYELQLRCARHLRYFQEAPRRGHRVGWCRKRGR